jgi:hypothetical protein
VTAKVRRNTPPPAHCPSPSRCARNRAPRRQVADAVRSARGSRPPRTISPGRTCWQRRRWDKARGLPFAGTLLRKAASTTEVDGDAPVDLCHWGLLDVSLASWGRACGCGPAPMLCLSGVLTAGAHRGSAAPVTARSASAVAVNRATLGRWLLIRFDSVAMLILLTRVAA